MVSFRLSPREYQRFQSLCAAHGVRSISDLARTGLYRLISGENQIDPLYFEVGDLRHQVQLISGELERLSGVLNARKSAGG